MRRSTILLAALLALGLTQPAAAASASITSAFGNTIKATYPDGRFQRYWLKADGSWTAIGRRGHGSSGKWTAKGDEVCLRQTKPLPMPNRYCTTFPADAKLGADWAAKDMGGHPIRLSLVKGRS